MALQRASQVQPKKYWPVLVTVKKNVVGMPVRLLWIFFSEIVCFMHA